MTSMALAHCFLGKFLGVVCHCFPPLYIYIYTHIYIYILINYSAVAGECVCMMVHYRVHNSRPFDPILSHISSVHALTSCFFNIPFNSIISYTLISSNWSLSFSFPHQNPACVSLLPHTCHTHCPSHPPLCVHPHTIR